MFARDGDVRAGSGEGGGGDRIGPSDRADDDERSADPSVGNVRQIGLHGLYRFDLDAGTIELAPLAAPLTTAERAALAQPRAVHVPAADVPEFLRAHFHAVARSIAVASRDGSFTPPPAPPAALVLDARFEPGDVLRLAWRWEHADGRTSPVEASVAVAADDPELDDDLLARVDDELGWVPLEAVILRGADAAEFTAERLPRLERLAEHSALRIDVTGERPDYREATAVPQVTITTVESLKPDWFDLGVVLTVDGRLVPFMPLFRALAKGQKRLLLVDKSYLMLNQPVFAPLRELIEEAGTLAEWETGLRIHRSQTSLWADFEDLADVAEPAVEWRRLVAGLEDGRVEELPQPAGVALPLRPYQLAGFRWLAFLWANRLGGVLADDMGLGKTAQTLALIAHTVEQQSTDAGAGSRDRRRRARGRSSCRTADRSSSSRPRRSRRTGCTRPSGSPRACGSPPSPRPRPSAADASRMPRHPPTSSSPPTRCSASRPPHSPRSSGADSCSTRRSS